MLTSISCEYEECEYKMIEMDSATAVSLLGIHERARHTVKVEVEPTSRKGKRMESKPPVFTDIETKDEFQRKKAEFSSYVERTGITGIEVSDDLYRSCETSLKRKLIASSKVKDPPKDTDRDILMNEIKRLSTPKVNKVIEHLQLKNIKQEEDENITDFESRIRVKIAGCEYQTCMCR